MLEENIGRATGTMSYESHNNPVWYNFVTLVAGALPYTLLGVLALTVRGLWKRDTRGFKGWFDRLRRNPGPLFALTAALVVFIFFSIPESKRSVYLLPMYPFVGFFIMHLWNWLNSRGRPQAKVFAGIIAWAIAVATAAIFLLAFARAVVPDTLNPPLAKATGAPELLGSWWALFLSLLLFLEARHVITNMGKSSVANLEKNTIALLVVGYTVALAAYMPPLLNAKSDLPMAENIARLLPEDKPLYQYLDDPRMRYYTINFYLGDRVRPVQSPDSLQAGDMVLFTRVVGAVENGR